MEYTTFHGKYGRLDLDSKRIILKANVTEIRNKVHICPKKKMFTGKKIDHGLILVGPYVKPM